MLKIITWKWSTGQLHPKKQIQFTSRHVNNLFNMLKRNVTIPFEFICITDNEKGLEPGIKVIPLWNDHLDMGGCFVRLKCFTKEMAELIGPRFVSLDLDVVIVSNIDHILSRKEDFLIWGEHTRKNPYCGSLFMMDAGAREKKVWKSFRPELHLLRRRIDGTYPRGTDQFHINDKLYPNEVMLTTEDGIYNFHQDIEFHYTKKELQGIREELAEPILTKAAVTRLKRMALQVVKEPVSGEKPPELKEALPISSFRRKRMRIKEAEAKKEGIEAIDNKIKVEIKKLDKANEEILKRKTRIKAQQLATKRHKQIQKVMTREVGEELPRLGGDGSLPDNACIIFFNGKSDPSQGDLHRKYPWIEENWK